MADTEFEILIGAKLKDSDLANIRSELNNLKKEFNNDSIKIGLDAKGVSGDIKEIKSSLSKLDNIDISLGKSLGKDIGNISTVVTKLNTNLSEMKASIGTIGKNSDMKSILATINNLSSSLTGIIGQLDKIITKTNAGSKAMKYYGGNSKQALDSIVKQRQQLENKLKDTLGMESGEDAVYHISQNKRSNRADSLYGAIDIAKKIPDEQKRIAAEIEANQKLIDHILSKAKIKKIDLGDVFTGEGEIDKSAGSVREMGAALNSLDNIDLSGVITKLDQVVAGLSKITSEIKKLPDNIKIEIPTQQIESASQSAKELSVIIDSFGEGSGLHELFVMIKNIGFAIDGLATDVKAIATMDFNIGNGGINTFTTNINEAGDAAERNRRKISATLADLEKMSKFKTEIVADNAKSVGVRSTAKELGRLIYGQSKDAVDNPTDDDIKRALAGYFSKSRYKNRDGSKIAASSLWDVIKNNSDDGIAYGEWNGKRVDQTEAAKRLIQAVSEVEKKKKADKRLDVSGIDVSWMSRAADDATQSSEQYDAATENMEQSSKEAQNALRGIGNINIDLSGVTGQLEKVISKLDEAVVAINRLGSAAGNINQISTALHNAGNAAGNMVNDVNKASGIMSADDIKNRAKTNLEAFKNGVSRDELLGVNSNIRANVGGGSPTWSRQDVYGNDLIKVFAEAEKRLDKNSERVGNDDRLYPSAENVRTLFTKLTNLDERAAKLDENSNRQEIDTLKRHYSELDAEFDDLWKRYKDKFAERDQDLAVREGALTEKIAKDKLSDKGVNDKDIRELERIQAERQEMNQLQTHMQQVLKEGRNRLELDDARIKDAQVKDDINKAVKDYIDSEQRLGEYQRKLMTATEGSDNWNQFNSRIEEEKRNREDALKRLDNLTKDGKYEISDEQYRKMGEAALKQDRLTADKKSDVSTKERAGLERDMAKARDSIDSEKQKQAAKAEAEAQRKTNEELKKYKDLLQEVANLKTRAKKLETSGDKDGELIGVLDSLERKQSELGKMDDNLLPKLNDEQLEEIIALEKDIADNARIADGALDDMGAKKSKAEELKQTNKECRDYISLLKQIGRLEKQWKEAEARGASKKEIDGIVNKLDGKYAQAAEIEARVTFNDDQLAKIKAIKKDLADDEIIIDARINESKINKTLDDLIKKEKELNRLKVKISDPDLGEEQYRDAVENIQKLRREILGLKHDLGGVSVMQQGNLTDKQHEKYRKAFADNKRSSGEKVSAFADKAVDGYDKQVKEIDKLGRKLSEIPKQSGYASEAMETLRTRQSALEAAVKEYTAALRESGAGSDRAVAAAKRVADAQKEVEKAYEHASDAIKQNGIDNKADADTAKLMKERQSFMSSLALWESQNSRAMNVSQYADEVARLRREVRNCDKETLSNLKHEFRQLDKNVRAAGQGGLTTIDKLKNKFREYASYAVASMGIMEVVQGIRYMAQEVLEVDTAMTGLLRVTEMTNSETEVMFDKMVDSAKEYGRTLTDTINATADWVRAGFDENTALGLAEVTAMYQNVSDLDYKEASENLLTSFNGFKQQLMGDYGGNEVAAVEHITDVLNELDNTFSVTSAGLGEGLSRSASALQIAGNTFEESAAMIGAVTEVTQDPEKAGNAMKILSLRLRGMKGELEEIEAGASEGVESISKMQTQILNMTKGHVNIFDSNGDFKSTFEIMQGITEIWDELSTIDQANLLETIAGKHRANDVAALIENWENAAAMEQSAMNAAGSASKENARTVDSLQGRINSLTATWQDFANTVMESDLLKGLVSGADAALGVFTKLVDVVGTLPTLLGLAAGVLSFTSFKNILPFSVEKNNLTSAIQQVKIFGKSLSEVKSIANAVTSASGGKKSLAGILGDSKVILGKHGSAEVVERFSKDIRLMGEASKGTAVNIKSLSGNAQELLTQLGKVRKVGNETFVSKLTKEDRVMLGKQLLGTETMGVTSTLATSKDFKDKATALNQFNKMSLAQQKEFVKQTALTDRATSKYYGNIVANAEKTGKALNAAQGAGNASMVGLTKSLIGAKIATIGLQVATMALNMALTMGLAFAIQKIVEGLMWLQKTFFPTAKQVAESVTEIMDNFEELNDKAKNAKKVAQDVGKSYVELAKGVNALTNENKNLSSEEYQEYLDVTNQIAEAMPSLVRGYDSQGNAILTCAGNVEKLADAYKDLQIKANDAILGDASTIIKDFENDIKKASGKNWKDWGFLSWIDDDIDKESYDMLSEWSADFSAANFEALESIKAMQAAATAAGAAVGGAIGAVAGFFTPLTTLTSAAGIYAGGAIGGIAGGAIGHMLTYISQDVDSLDEISKAFEQLGYEKQKSLGGLVSEDDLSHITRVLEEDPNVSQKVMRSYEAAIEPLADEMRDVAGAYISNAFLEGDYDEISDSMESMITQMVPNLSTEFFQGFIGEDGNFNSIGFYNELNSVMDTFNSLSPQQEKKFEVFVDMQSKYNSGDITVNEYLAEVEKLESMLNTLDPEVQKSIKLVLGIDKDDVLTDKNAILDDLKNELDMSDEIAEYFVGNMSSGELKVMYDLIAEGNIDKSMIDEYEQVYSDFANMAESYGRTSSDLSRSIWGNIDMDNREAIEWNAESLYKYSDAIESWGDSLNGLKEGDISTVLGSSKNFGEGIENFNNGKGIEIAFSPILQTEDGAELLSSGTVDKYINGILEKALEDGEFSEAELMSFDMTGLEIDGQRVSGLIAAIGDDARYTGEALHYMGEEGALSMTRLVQEYERENKINMALEYTIDMSAEGEEVSSLGKLNTALQETVSGSGLTAESISALENRYSSLAAEGYDLSKMFDVSSNGIRLNRQELGKLEAAYSKQKFDETAEHIEVLKEEYDRLNETISDPTATAAERANANSRQKAIQEQINNLGILMAQYDGLSSAYSRWQNLESAGQERDMYESIIQGLDTLDDETGRGWIDDGSIALLEVLTGRTDLATASAEELKKVYGDLDDTINSAGYSIRDFFTVDDEGNSTNKGVYNFLRTVEALENSDVLNSEGIAFKDIEGIENLVQKDADGKIVAFDFKVAGGDEAIAEALGVGEELVQIMLRAADDAGFAVNIEGAYTAMAELETAAEESAKRISETFGIDINLNASGEDFTRTYAQAAGLLAQYKNSDGTIKAEFINEDGSYVQELQDVLNVMSSIVHKKDDLEEPAYMTLEASDVEAELQEPLEQAQYFQDLLRTKHQLEIVGADTSEIEASMMEIAGYFDSLPNHMKDSLDLEGLNVEQIYSKLESGELKIPTALDLQLNMSEDLNMLVKTALYEAGLMSGDQEKAFEEELKIYLNPDVDASGVDDEIDQAVDSVANGEDVANTTVDVNVDAGDINTGIIEDEIIDGVPNVIDIQTDVEVDVKDVDTSAAQEGIQEAFDNGDKVTFTGGEYYYDSYGSKPLGSKYQGQEVYVTNTNQGAALPYHISTGSQLGDGDLGWVGEYQIMLVPTIDPNANPYALLREDEYVIDVDADTTAAEEKVNPYALLREDEYVVDVDADTTQAEEKVDNSMALLREGVDYDPTVSIDADISDLEAKADEASAIVDGMDYGDIGDPSGIDAFVEGAKALKELGSFETNITANVFGNVVDEWEFRLNNLQEFAKGAHLLKNVGSYDAEVNANVFGNVIDEFEFRLNNLQEFAKGAHLLKDVGSVNASVVANVYGNVKDEFEYQINNLEVFAESASGLKDLGSFSSNITANVFGNVTDKFEYKINNLEEFAESAKGLKELGSFGSNVAANISGNVVDEWEFRINNLEEFAESAKGLKEIGSITSNVTANLNGNIDDTFEFKINNLKTFVDSAQGLKEIGTINSTVTANVGGNVLTEFEFSINNLETFAEGANLLKGIDTINATVNANIGGNVDDTFEFKINNLETFAESAKKLQDVGDADVTVTGNVGGAVLTTPEFMTNNLLPFAEAAQKLNGIEDVSTTISANIDGDVDDTFEFKINNLIPFADAAQKLNGIEDVSTSITATINNGGDGTNATDMWESKINNLIPFADAASKLNGIGDVTTTVTATLKGELSKDINLDSLIKFAQAAGMLQGVESCDVTIDAGGEFKWEGSVDTLIQFAQAAKELQGVESREIVIDASVADGLTVEDVTNLGTFASVVSSLSTVSSPTITVTINVDSAMVDNAISTMQKLMDNSGLFVDYTSTVTVNGNVYWYNDSSVVDAFKNQIHEATGTVKWGNNEANVKKHFTATGSVNWTSGNNVQVRVLQSIEPQATGTAHAGGTTGRAFARGNWGVGGNGVALGGELGQELVRKSNSQITYLIAGKS